MQVSSSYPTCLQGINKIYTFEGESGIGTVFIEFDKTQILGMEWFCSTISKSPDLLSDYRIPKDANKGFCFGFTTRDKVESLEALIEKVENWVTCEKKQDAEILFEVPLVAVDASALKEDIAYMLQKNYCDLIYKTVSR